MEREKLIDYLRHKDDCKVMNSEIIRIDDLIEECDTQEEFDVAYEKRKSEIPCTCGLSKLLQSLTAPDECEQCKLKQEQIERLGKALGQSINTSNGKT